MFRKTPVYSLHKTSGQARVRIDGQEIYLGKYDSPESRDRYDELISAWLHRQELSSVTLTIAELALLFMDHARAYYVKDGRETSEVHDIRAALRLLIAHHGRERVRDFGPVKLKKIREAMVAKGWARKSINSHVQRIRRMFRWGVENEHVPPQVLTGLAAVAGLRQGKSAAKDRPRVKPIDEKTVDATLPHLPPIVADMVRLQLLTGMRPAEVCQLRPGDIDRSEPTWTYRPASHKNEHLGRDRVVFIGPLGQAVLAPYLLRAADAFCFSPAESERRRRAERHEARKTPLHHGNRPGRKNPNAKRPPRERYDSNTYRVAIVRGCDGAFPFPGDESEAKDVQAVKAWRENHRWSPNQLRHTFATRVRKEFGLEAAQVLLGHSFADVTQVYAERDAEKGEAVAAAVG